MACEDWQTLSPRTGLFLTVRRLEPPDVYAWGGKRALSCRCYPAWKSDPLMERALWAGQAGEREIPFAAPSENDRYLANSVGLELT